MDAEIIRKCIISIMEGQIPLVSSWCTVKAVQWEDKTCDVIIDQDEDLVLSGILLGFDKAGSCTKPKVNSDVLVMFIDNTKTLGAVVMVQEADDVEIMGKNFGEIPVLEKISDNLETIKDYLSKLNTNIGTGLTSVGAGTAANGPAGKTAFDAAQATNIITYEDMKGKAKHGNGQ